MTEQPFLDDEPISLAEEDRLERESTIGMLAEVVEKCMTPFAVGLHGDWGSGKTSMLKRLAGHLREQEDSNNHVVLFEMWRYQFESQPAVALLHHIREHFSRAKKIWDDAGDLLDITAYTALSVFKELSLELPGFGVSFENPYAHAREGERLRAQERLTAPLSADVQHKLLQDAITKLVGDDGRLVILIDDLDRCNDVAAVRLLEAIKIYFRVKQCVFVVAADHRAVTRAVKNVLFPQEGIHEAESYINKLFQLTAQVPYPVNIEALIKPRLEQIIKDPEDLNEVLELLEQTDPLPRNPRRIKRFLNEFAARCYTMRAIRNTGGRSTHHSVHWALLLAVQCIQSFHPSLYRVLQAKPHFVEEIILFANNPYRLSRGETHEYLRDLVVVGKRHRPEWFNVEKSTSLRDGDQEAETFHDPGDGRVFWSADLWRHKAVKLGQSEIATCLLRQGV